MSKSVKTLIGVMHNAELGRMAPIVHDVQILKIRWVGIPGSDCIVAVFLNLLLIGFIVWFQYDCKLLPFQA